jgi:hypothetical protein
LKQGLLSLDPVSPKLRAKSRVMKTPGAGGVSNYAPFEIRDLSPMQVKSKVKEEN